MRYSCTQRGCEFGGDYETPPEICPVCGNPQNYDAPEAAQVELPATVVLPADVAETVGAMCDVLDTLEPRVAALEAVAHPALVTYATGEEFDVLVARVDALETAQADKEFGQPHHGHATVGEDAAPGPSIEDIASGAAADHETEPTVA